jgi:hypothetical protein
MFAAIIKQLATVNSQVQNLIPHLMPPGFSAAVEPESLSHYCVHSDEVTAVDLDSGREQVGVTQGRPELNPAGTSAGTRLREIRKSLPHMQLSFEARGGIEPSKIQPAATLY